jgi:hypothetical protein
VDPFEPQIRELLRGCNTMPATMIAERIGRTRGMIDPQTFDSCAGTRWAPGIRIWAPLDGYTGNDESPE